MLKWALIFLVLGIVAGLFGFTTIAGASIFAAKVLFFLCVAGFLIFVVLGFTAARKITR